VHLHFLKLASVEIAVSRVRVRVKQGGHNIPETVIRRRVESGYANFEHFYRNAVNRWACYENSCDRPILINWGTSNET
jgi:predicted ABC-type ATPase